mgnify:CR=1 FL=1|tara:strand:- start:411 stop:611 length:201 start_codon:yes stop_codon:yes gene_type:complete
MKTDHLSELEMFRMAVKLAQASLTADPHMITVMNKGDLIKDRIMECHEAVKSSALEILGKDSETSH